MVPQVHARELLSIEHTLAMLFERCPAQLSVGRGRAEEALMASVKCS